MNYNKIVNLITEKVMKNIHMINESVYYDDPYAVNEMLSNFGWAFSNAIDVRDKNTGRLGVRYIIEKDTKDAVDADTLQNEIAKIVGEDYVVFSQGRHRYAPEITNLSMVLMAKDDEDVQESYKRRVNEGAYGYPDGIDGLILFAENDRECYDIYSWLRQGIEKRVAKGLEVDAEHLANCQTMRKYQQLAIRKYTSSVEDAEQFSAEDKYNFRKFMAERMIEEV